MIENGIHDIASTFTIAVSFAITMRLIFSIEILFIDSSAKCFGCKSKIIDVSQWIVMAECIEIRPIYIPRGVLTNPPSHFGIVIAIPKIDEPNFFIDAFITISPRVPKRRI